MQSIIEITFWVYLKAILYLILIYTILWSAITGRNWREYKRLVLHIMVAGYFFVQLIVLLINISGEPISVAISLTDPARTVLLVFMCIGAWAVMYLNDRKDSKNLLDMSNKLIRKDNNNSNNTLNHCFSNKKG